MTEDVMTEDVKQTVSWLRNTTFEEWVEVLGPRARTIQSRHAEMIAAALEAQLGEYAEEWMTCRYGFICGKRSWPLHPDFRPNRKAKKRVSHHTCKFCDNFIAAIKSARDDDYRKRKYSNRRARELSSRAEKFTQAEVLEKTNGLCYLCWEPVDPDSFHCAHGIPIGPLGDTTLENIYAAHPECNIKLGQHIG